MANDDNNLAESASSAIENVDQVATEIGNAGVFDDPNVSDPGEALRLKRQKIEDEHQGLRGAFNYLLGLAHIEPTFQSKMNTPADADRKYKTGELQSNERLQAQQAQGKLQQWRTEMDSAVADEQETDEQRKKDSIERSYKSEVQAADDVATNKTYWSQGFKSQQEAQAYSGNIKYDAEAIRQSEFQKLDDSDAATARQAKLQEEQSDDRIAAFREEAKEAQLRGEGRNDDARVAGLDFSTQQRVRSLQEQADAETDPTRKAQLQREIAAAADAGKIERDALPQELQHASQVANSNLNARGGDTAGLSDVLSKLNAAAAKLDKVLANTKTLVLIKD